MSKWKPKSEKAAKEEGRRLKERLRQADLEDAPFMARMWAMLDEPITPEADVDEEAAEVKKK